MSLKTHPDMNGFIDSAFCSPFKDKKYFVYLLVLFMKFFIELKGKLFTRIVLIVIIPLQAISANIDSLLSVLETSKYPYKRAVTLEKIAEHYRIGSDYEKCLEYLEPMKEICLEHDYKSQLAEYYNIKGIARYNQGLHKESIKDLHTGLEIFIELGDSAGIANMYENLGLPYKECGQYQKAIEMQMKSMQIRESKGWKKRMPSLYLNIASLFEKLDRLDKMEEYMFKALHIAENLKEKDEKQLASVYNQMGNLYDNRGDYDSSLFYYNKALSMVKKINWKRAVAVVLGNIAGIYKSMGKLDLALEKHYESLLLEIEAKHVYGIIKEYQFIATIYLEQNKYNQALKMALKGYNLAKKHGQLKEIADLSKVTSAIYEKMNNIPRAFFYFKQYKQFSDSISGVQHKKDIVEIEERYQSTIKEQKIQLLTKENELQSRRIRLNRLAAFMVAGIALAIVFVVISLYRLRRKQEALQKADMEQKLLRNQMNPHFIFNALTAIQNFMYTNNPKEAGRYLSEFSTLTRSVLKHTREGHISLEEEIQTLKAYLELEKLRLKGSFTYEIIYDEGLETEFINLPPMLIQPFVENAIRHGIKEKKDGKVTLEIQEKSNNIIFYIRDNGIGIDSSRAAGKKDHISYAMKIFEERRKLLKRQFNLKIIFEIQDLKAIGGNGTEVRVKIPLKDDY